MRDTLPSQASGANLAFVGIALAGTVAFGALSRSKATFMTEELPRIDLPRPRINLEILERGTGTPNVPTAVPSVVWMKARLLLDGKPVYHRPIQFHRRAVDQAGRELLVEHRWSEGLYYVFVRKGYRQSKGSVALTLRHRDQFLQTFDLGPLPGGERQLLTAAQAPAWPGFKYGFVRRTGKNNTDLALEVKANLPADQALVVERIGSTYLAEEPYGRPYLVQSGSTRLTQAVPVNLGYPEDARSVSFRVRRMRSRKVQTELTFGLRFSAESPAARLFTFRENAHPLFPGVAVALARYERSLSLPKDFAIPSDIYLVGRGVVKSMSARLISPARIFGTPINLFTRVVTADRRRPQPISEAVGDARPALREVIPIRVAIEAEIFEPMDEATLIVPRDPKKDTQLPRIKMTRSLPFHTGI